MKVWITQYALTKGILTGEAEATHTPTMVAVACSGAINRQALVHKPDWHETYEEAAERVRAMIAAKRKSIEKQLQKLNKFDYEVRDFESVYGVK